MIYSNKAVFVSYIMTYFKWRFDGCPLLLQTRWLAAKAIPYSWKILALLFSTRESLYIFWGLNFTSLSILPFHTANLTNGLDVNMCPYWPRRFSPGFLVASWFTTLFWAGRFSWKWRNINWRRCSLHGLSNFNCAVTQATLFFTHECI